MWGPTLPCHVPLVPLHGSRHKTVYYVTISEEWP